MRAAHDISSIGEDSSDELATTLRIESAFEAAKTDAPAPLPEGRPPARVLRFVHAYWVTFQVLASYLSYRFMARFRSEAASARILREKHLKNARRVERAIVRLQGLFIKIGQLISIMTNFLPAEFRQELAGLQDQVPPRPYDDIEARIREEFQNREPEDLFAHFTRNPIASASIGQVHVATLASGQQVAVKVQYPDIERIVTSDLRTLKRILRIVRLFIPYDGLDDVYSEVSVMVAEELDFRAEARNVARVAEHFQDRPEIVFPVVVEDLSTQRVLTTHWEEGIKICDLERLETAGVDRVELARLVVDAYCQQIFTNGIYHADPHPGNLLVRREKNGELAVVFLDFGAVASVSPAMRGGIVEFLQAALARDTGRVVSAMKQMGFISRAANDQVFDQVVEYFYSRFSDQISLDSFNLRDIKFDPEKELEHLADLRRMDVSLRELSQSFHLPREWIVLHRTLLLLMGICTALDPTMNPMTVIRPHLERFVLGPEGDWSSLFVSTSKDLFLSIASLPTDIRKYVQSARAGELSFRVRNLERSSHLLYRAGQQLVFALLTVASVSAALVFEGRGELERAEWAWWGARGAGAAVLWSWWSGRRLMKRLRRH